MNESLLITQIIEKNGRAYAFFIPFQSPYEDVYAVLSEFVSANQENQKKAQEAEEKRKLDQDKNGVIEASSN
jgi:hypothetical protein